MSTQDDPIASAATEIMHHVNEDHAANLIEYLRAFTEVGDATDALMTSVDRTGFDIEAQTPGGSKIARIAWSAPLERREQVREEMVRMTQEAQAKLSP